MSFPLPHDAAYKQLFSNRDLVANLLQVFVPEDWVAQLDFATLEKENAEFVCPDLRSRRDDLIWRIRFRESRRCLYVYLILEFQSSIDYWMAARMPVYVSLLHNELIKTLSLKTGDHLPPVFPLVIYNGRPRWNAPRKSQALIEKTTPQLDHYQLKLDYALLDIGQIPRQALDEMQGICVELVRLERCGEPEEVRLLVTRLRKLLQGEHFAELRRSFSLWIQSVILARVLPTEIRSPLNPMMETLEEVETMLAETVDGWVRRWKQEGLEEGLERGMEKGLEKGQQKVFRILDMQFARRFGPLPPEALQRLRNASDDEILAWSTALLDAPSLEAVFETKI